MNSTKIYAQGYHNFSTSRIEMLELPNFGHMTTCTSKYKYTQNTQNIYLYFKKT